MLKWYYGMALRNMHAVEEVSAGSTYNKADFWGLVGDMKKKEVSDMKCLKSEDPTKRVYLFTKSSKYLNLQSMMQTHLMWKPLIPLPYNYMKRLQTFETKKSVIDSSLWMSQD